PRHETPDLRFSWPPAWRCCRSHESLAAPTRHEYSRASRGCGDIRALTRRVENTCVEGCIYRSSAARRYERDSRKQAEEIRISVYADEDRVGRRQGCLGRKTRASYLFAGPPT